MVNTYPVCRRFTVNKPSTKPRIRGYRAPLPLWLLWHRNGLYGAGTGNPGKGRKPWVAPMRSIPLSIQLTPAFYSLCPNP